MNKKEMHNTETLGIVVIPLLIIFFLITKNIDVSTVVIIVLMVVVFGVEKHYISRLSILPNVCTIALLVIGKWSELPKIFQIYLGTGIVLGIIGVFYYYNHHSMKKLNKVAYALFSMKTIIPIYITFILVDLTTQSNTYIVLTLLLGYFWYIGIKKLKHDKPF